MSVLCTDAWGSLNEKPINFGSDAVIDIIWARVALLGKSSLCSRSFDVTVAKIISDDPDYCIADLPFVL